MQGDATDDIRAGEITRSRIDLRKITKPHKASDPKVRGPYSLPPCGQGAEKSSFPTLTHTRAFGNTRNLFFPVKLIFSLSLDLPVRSVASRIATGRLPPTGDMPLTCSRSSRKSAFLLPVFSAISARGPFLYCRAS